LQYPKCSTDFKNASYIIKVWPKSSYLGELTRKYENQKFYTKTMHRNFLTKNGFSIISDLNF